MNAVRSLPMLDRQIVSLYLDGLEYAEIEEITGLTRTNIGARLTRARQTLAQCIRRKGAEHAR